jgi:hypothetical protein
LDALCRGEECKAGGRRGEDVKEETPGKPVKEEAAEGKTAKVSHADKERTVGEDQEDGTSKE